MADAPISEELTALRRRARRRLVGAVALVLAALVVLWTVMDDKPPQSLTGQPVTIVSSDPSLVSTVSPVPQAAKPNLTLPTAVAPVVAPPVAIPPAAAVPANTAHAVAPVPSTVAEQAKPAVAPMPAVPVANPTPVKLDTVADSKPSPAHADSKPATPAKKPADTPAKDAKKDQPHKDPAKILAGMDDLAAPAHAKPSAPTDDAAKFYLQLGAFADHDKANGLVGKASAAGVSVKHEAVKTDKGELYRLRAGPYASKAEAVRAHDRLASAGISSSVVGK